MDEQQLIDGRGWGGVTVDRRTRASANPLHLPIPRPSHLAEIVISEPEVRGHFLRNTSEPLTPVLVDDDSAHPSPPQTHGQLPPYTHVPFSQTHPRTEHAKLGTQRQVGSGALRWEGSQDPLPEVPFPWPVIRITESNSVCSRFAD